jgi:hypothetical protein
MAHYKGWRQNLNIDPETVFAYTDNGWTKDYVGCEESFRKVCNSLEARKNTASSL